MKQKMVLWILGTIITITLVINTGARAANCDQTSVGFTPINDLGTGLYLDQFQGGLFPNGLNSAPYKHFRTGYLNAHRVEPLDTTGNPYSQGKVVLMSIGMANTTQEFCSENSEEPCGPWTFMGLAENDARVDHSRLVIVNGARSGRDASAWDSPDDPIYNFIRDNRLGPKGLTEPQVQVVWAKMSSRGPTVSLPNIDADAYILKTQLGNIARTLKVRYPNIKLLFFSSRIYAGYASITLNPEPYAYESGLAVKWVIEAQIEQKSGGGIDPMAGDLNYDTVTPWIGWSPYLWADGLTPRSDGLIWECSDFEDDGTHPSTSGETKVASMLFDFMLDSPFSACWFRAGEVCDAIGDFDRDCYVDADDLDHFEACATGPMIPHNSDQCLDADVDGDGDVDQDDFGVFQMCFSGSGQKADPLCLE